MNYCNNLPREQKLLLKSHIEPQHTGIGWRLIGWKEMRDR